MDFRCKVNKWWVVYLFLGMFTTAGFAQNERAEVKFMECAYQVYSDNGATLHQLMISYENLLIEEGIMADGSGVSYRNIYKGIVTKNAFEKVPSQSFIDKMMQLKPDDIDKGDDCIKTLMVDTDNYDLSKMEGLEMAVNNSENSFNLEPGKMAEEVLSILSAEDFELDYYKMRTFMLFEMMNHNLGIARKPSNLEDATLVQDLNSPLMVFIDGENLIFINSEMVDIDQLKLRVRAYEQENKEASLIILQTVSETQYDSYLAVQNAIVQEIQIMRKEFAEQKYKSTLEELDKEQLAEIKALYPLNISE